MLFPKNLPNTEAIQVAALYLPHQEVGGDYYDFIKLNMEVKFDIIKTSISVFNGCL